MGDNNAGFSTPNNEEIERLMREKENASDIKFDTPEQPAIAPTSLGKTQAWHEQQERENETPVDIGWKPYPVETLPSRGLYYPEGASVLIRAANVEEVRHWSTIDETDPLDLDDKLNLVVSKCLQVKFPDRHASWKDLKEEDRFCLIFAIRDLTFKNGENKLFLNIKCGNTCLGDGTFNEKVEMRNDNFDYYKIDESLIKHYSPEEGCFVLNSPKIGSVKMYVPSLGVTTFIKNHVRDKIRKNEYYDKSFLKVAPFLFQDWRMLNEKSYKKMEIDSVGWNPLKLSVILKTSEMIRFGVKTTVQRTCNKCGAEVSTPLTFPGGVKSIFLHAGTLDELLG